MSQKSFIHESLRGLANFDLASNIRTLHAINPEEFEKSINEIDPQEGVPRWFAFFSLVNKANPRTVKAIDKYNWSNLLKESLGSVSQALVDCGADFSVEVEAPDGKKYPAWIYLLKSKDGDTIFNYLGENRNGDKILAETFIPHIPQKSIEDSVGFAFHRQLYAIKFKETLKALWERGARPDAEEVGEIEKIFEKAYFRSDLKNELISILARSLGEDKGKASEIAYEQIIKVALDMQGNLKLDNSDAILQTIDESFDSWSEEQKRELLSTTMSMGSLSVAKHLSKKMGCPLSSPRGLKKALPLLRSSVNGFFSKKFLELGLLKQEFIESEYGKVNTILTYCRTLSGVKSFIGVERAMNEAFDGQKMIDLFLSKDEDGQFLLRKERAFCLDLKRRGLLPRSEYSEEWGKFGILDKMARWGGHNRVFGKVSSRETSGDGEVFFVEAQSASFEEKEKIKKLVQLVLFDEDKKVRQGFILDYWSMFDEGWLGKIDKLYSLGLVGTEDACLLLKEALNCESDSPMVTSYGFLDRAAKQVEVLEKTLSKIEKSEDFKPEFLMGLSSQTLIDLIKKNHSSMLYEEKRGPVLKKLDEIEKRAERLILLEVGGGKQKMDHKPKNKL